MDFGLYLFLLGILFVFVMAAITGVLFLLLRLWREKYPNSFG
jgi:hypothetical protein